jgi:hypothetical protein
MLEDKGKYGRHILKFSTANTEKMKNAMRGRNCSHRNCSGGFDKFLNVSQSI